MVEPLDSIILTYKANKYTFTLLNNGTIKVSRNGSILDYIIPTEDFNKKKSLANFEKLANNYIKQLK